MNPLDRRLNAFRADLADEKLRGKVEAERFTDGRAMVVRTPVVDLKPRPAKGAGTDTQLLMGDRVTVFDQADGWAWLQSREDGYVGYAPANALAFPGPEATHIVTAQRTFLYPTADMKVPPVAAISMGSRVAVTGSAETRNTLYAELSGGRFVLAGHIAPVDETVQDWVSVAETLLHAPYLWGGASGFGIDCSALIQLSRRVAGYDELRDSDMLGGTLGDAIDAPERRGDCVFWKGHCGIMLDGETLLHANGHTNDVAIEPLAQAVERIAYLYARPTGYRRPNVR